MRVYSRTFKFYPETDTERVAVAAFIDLLNWVASDNPPYTAFQTWAMLDSITPPEAFGHSPQFTALLPRLERLGAVWTLEGDMFHVEL